MNEPTGVRVTVSSLFVPSLPIARHGVVGDRRTAALIAADGAVNWLCLPAYDGQPVFGALIDTERGGRWCLGPASSIAGRQRYREHSAVLVTSWNIDGAELELTDAMAWPWNERAEGDGGPDDRALLRRLRCVSGEIECAFDLWPRGDFDRAARIYLAADGAVLDVGHAELRLSTSQPFPFDHDRVGGPFQLQQGEEVWAVLASGPERRSWTVERARHEMARADRFWQDWSAPLRVSGARAERVRRSALTVHLLSYAPTGSPVAAPTTSLPERIGGDRNWDYRYAWVRDASLALAMITQLGDADIALRYLDCLATYRSTTESPLQIVYGVDGGTDLPVSERNDVTGYRESRPVRVGNRACGQRQLDSLGFFADCALIYLEHGGQWRDNHWTMIQRAADYTARKWRTPDSGIWELPVEQHYISSKVMSWVALDRAVKIAERTGHRDETDGWRVAMTEIHAEVMERGWSDRLGAFRQRYETDTLDAATLLIPLTGFLAADHPRVLATLDRIVQTLTIDGLVHRFVPAEMPGEEDECLPVGEFEGAFLPCTFWLAAALARAGRVVEAEAILDRVESAAGDLGLFAEEIDADDGSFLGNYPLLFSEVEYVRAVHELDAAKERIMANLTETSVA